MRNKILTAILVLILPLFITACTVSDIPVIGTLFGGEKNASQKDVSLSIWGLWESPEAFSTLIGKYNEQNPKVTINYDDRSVIKPGQHKETIKTRLAQEGAPDILLVHNTWVKELKDFLSPMPTNLMDSTSYSSKFYPVSAESAVIDGNIYAVPAHYDGLVLVYNKDHFDEIDQDTPPTAWEEFRRLALSLTIKTEDGEFVRSGAAIGTADNIDFFSDILGLMFAQAGVNIPEDLDSRSAQDALAYYVMFSNEDEVWDNTLPEASTAFAQEKVSMIFVPSWNILDIIKARPDLNIGVAPVPQALPDDPVSWASFWMYAVPKNSANQKEAWEFINYLAQDEQELQLFDLSSRYRAYGAPYASSSLASQVSVSGSGKYIKSVLDTAPFAKSSLFTGRSGNTTYVEALKVAVNSLISGNTSTRPTYEEALQTVKKTVAQN